MPPRSGGPRADRFLLAGFLATLLCAVVASSTGHSSTIAAPPLQASWQSEHNSHKDQLLSNSRVAAGWRSAQHNEIAAEELCLVSMLVALPKEAWSAALCEEVAFAANTLLASQQRSEWQGFQGFECTHQATLSGLIR
jgi:hypothetical protein